MRIIGCDWHTHYEQITTMETTTGQLHRLAPTNVAPNTQLRARPSDFGP